MPLLVRVVAAVVVARFSRLTIDHATADLTSALARRPIGERRFWLRARELLSPHRFVWAFSFGRFRLFCRAAHHHCLLAGCCSSAQSADEPPKRGRVYFTQPPRRNPIARVLVPGAACRNKKSAVQSRPHTSLSTARPPRGSGVNRHTSTS